MRPHDFDPPDPVTRRAVLLRRLQVVACLSLVFVFVGCSDGAGTAEDDHDEAVRTYNLISHVIRETLYRVPSEYESIIANAVDNGWLDSDSDVTFETFIRLTSTGSRRLEVYRGIQQERDYAPSGDLESEDLAETYEPRRTAVLIEMVVGDTLYLSSERDTLIDDAEVGGEEAENAAHDIDIFMRLSTTQARVNEIVDELEIPDEYTSPDD